MVANLTKLTFFFVEGNTSDEFQNPVILLFIL